MTVQKVFHLDDTVMLPSDIVIRFPEPYANPEAPPAPGCSSCSSGGGCSSTPAKTAEVLNGVMKKFLALSSSAAAYVALDRELLEAFERLRDGATVREALQLLRDQFGAAEGRRRLRELLTHLSMRNFFADAVREEYIPNAPLMQLYVTNRCNLRCRHCYMSSGEALPQGEIGTEERLRALEIFAGLSPGGKVTFTGGEALVDPDIFVLLERAHALGLWVELYSNGLTIRDRRAAERIAGVVDELQISLDGASAAVNDAVRGAGTFERIIRAIKLADAAAEVTANRRFRFRIAMTLTPGNVADVRDNLEGMIAGLDLASQPEIRIGAVSKLGRAAENQDIFSNADEIRLAQVGVIHELAERGVYQLPIFATNRFTKTCGMGATITVGADGAIYPCTITDQRSIGNLRQPDAEAVMRSVIGYVGRTNVDQVEGCRECAMRYFCGGMCRINNYFQRGSMTVSSCTDDYKRLMVRDLIAKYESFSISAGLTAADS